MAARKGTTASSSSSLAIAQQHPPQSPQQSEAQQAAALSPAAVAQKQQLRQRQDSASAVALATTPDQRSNLLKSMLGISPSPSAPPSVSSSFDQRGLPLPLGAGANAITEPSPASNHTFVKQPVPSPDGGGRKASLLSILRGQDAAKPDKHRPLLAEAPSQQQQQHALPATDERQQSLLSILNDTGVDEGRVEVSSVQKLLAPSNGKKAESNAPPLSSNQRDLLRLLHSEPSPEQAPAIVANSISNGGASSKHELFSLLNGEQQQHEPTPMDIDESTITPTKQQQHRQKNHRASIDNSSNNNPPKQTKQPRQLKTMKNLKKTFVASPAKGATLLMATRRKQLL